MAPNRAHARPRPDRSRRGPQADPHEAARLERRRASVPPIRYPAELPVSQRRDDLAAAIRDHQVVIVAGETGSGKTTQLPKICLELGRGVEGMIGHTQPRRLAARTVADRIAEELGSPPGAIVASSVRFDDRVGDDTLVRVMTDGILLTDLHRDPDLRAYDTLIIDEAHERSLNIDFILGYLKQLLPRRPDLKVVVTSATIDPERFAAHFDGAPVVEVSGRTYPVEVRYRPLGGGAATRDRHRVDDDDDRDDRDDRDPLLGFCDAVRELRREGPGDILAFFSGEREIRDAADALRKLDLPDTEVLPLYARLSAAEQHRVFAPHRGRRVVLATNVAETSLTVPGIRYVIDNGTARISRYSHRLKVQRLPIEAISKASANQRAGRCGRVAPGVCIRLYAEDDFERRPDFTEPEILRTNLASVILQMTWLGLGDVTAFPFVEPPDRRAVADGYRLLHELRALDTDRPDAHARLTPIGRKMARLPVDPRFARMVIEAGERGCLREVLVIAAALSIEDPRERPADKAQAADELHGRFADPSSDFLAFLGLWRHVRERQRALNGSQFRKLCRNEHLNFLRVREWQDVHAQLRRVAAELGMRQSGNDAAPDEVHRALLAGLLSHIGVRDRETREYRGARHARFAVFPGSTLAKKPPQWVMAAELVETSRLWARTVARIRPEWAEELAPHLTKHAYTDPHWSSTRGAAMVEESVTLYGLPVVTRRLVPYATIDREHARELFIQHALVEGDWRSAPAFVPANRELLEAIDALGQRYRRRDLLRHHDVLYEQYDERLPARIVSARHFDSWWKKVRRTDPDRLTFTREQLLSDTAGGLDPASFPDTWTQGALQLDLTYSFDPGGAMVPGSTVADGVSVHVPLAVLNQVRDEGFDWQVPGLREERVVAFIRSLPKPLRRNLVPVPHTATAVLERLTSDGSPGREPFAEALARELARVGGDRIRRDSFDAAKIPDHLTVTYVIEDDAGAVVAQGKDLAALKHELAPEVRATITDAARAIELDGLRDWTFGEVPRRAEIERAGRVVVTYPALVDAGDEVRLRAFETRDEQLEAHWAGIRRLVRLTVPMPARAVKRRLVDGATFALAANPYATTGGLVEDCLVAALDSLLAEHGAPVWDAVAFDELREQVRKALPGRADEIAALVDATLERVWRIDRLLAEPVPAVLIPAYDDLTGQRIALIADGFVTAAGWDHLPTVARATEAMLHRLESVAANPRRDRERMAEVHRAEQAYGKAVDALAGTGAVDVELERIGWLIEELRISLFAQHLRAREPVSLKRILTALDALR